MTNRDAIYKALRQIPSDPRIKKIVTIVSSTMYLNDEMAFSGSALDPTAVDAGCL